jgi:lipopolysaccharide export system protein LptA
MTYDKNLDALTLLDQAVVQVAPDADEPEAVKITAGVAEFRRPNKAIRFDRAMNIVRGAQLIEAENGVAQLGGSDDHLERLELRGKSRIANAGPAEGGLKDLTGTNMDLEYAPDGRSLQRVNVLQSAAIVVAGETTATGRRISADQIDITFGRDGVTPVALRANEDVVVMMPSEAGSATRRIESDTFEASGQEGQGLTNGQFRGDVVFREQGAGADRAAQSVSLNVVLEPGLGAIQEAQFSGTVRFRDGGMNATAARAAYGIAGGTLSLWGDDGRGVPRLVNERISIEAGQIDITLAGPLVQARGAVKSELSPRRDQAASKGAATGATGAAAGDRRLPSMLRQDQTVLVVADDLSYDGPASRAIYNGNARLSQGDTSIKASSIALDEKSGDLSANGAVVTTTVLEQTTKGRKEKISSIARAERFVYQESLRRATYGEQAQVSGPHGEMRSAKVELYLGPSGNELDRVEAYDDVTLSEQRRRTTGTRLTYFSGDERYVVVGTPVTIVDECGRQTTGRTLTFYQNTDRIVMDGNEQIRTRTSGTSTCS